MIDPKHLFTVHATYTGEGCAVCGRAPVDHESLDWLVAGVRTPDPLERETHANVL